MSVPESDKNNVAFYNRKYSTAVICILVTKMNRCDNFIFFDISNKLGAWFYADIINLIPKGRLSCANCVKIIPQCSLMMFLLLQHSNYPIVLYQIFNLKPLTIFKILVETENKPNWNLIRTIRTVKVKRKKMKLNI